MKSKENQSDFPVFDSLEIENCSMNFDKIIQPRCWIIHDICNYRLIFATVISNIHSFREYFFKFFISLFDFWFRFFCWTMLLRINIILFLFCYWNSFCWRTSWGCRCELLSRSWFFSCCCRCRTLLQGFKIFFGENLKFIKIRTPFLSVPSSTRPVEFFYEYLPLMVSGDRLENFYHPGQMKIRYLRKLSLKPRGFPRNLFLDNFYMHLLYSPI